MDNSPKPTGMTDTTTITTTPFSPASNPTAQKLLSSKRCRQIEIWLGEAVQYEALQACATGQLCGHASEGGGGGDASPALVSAQVCPVCHKPLGDSSNNSHTTTRPSKYHPVKPRAMLRGLKTAMTPFSSSRPKRKIITNTSSEEETCDPALTTQMFLIALEGGSQEDKNGRKDGKAPRARTCPSHSSSSATSVAGLDSSDDEQDGVDKILSERMARLKRAQKLLEKSQGKKG